MRWPSLARLRQNIDALAGRGSLRRGLGAVELEELVVALDVVVPEEFTVPDALEPARLPPNVTALFCVVLFFCVGSVLASMP